MINVKVPQVVFRTRVRDESIGGDNPFQQIKLQTIISNQRQRFLPGAFTPTCSTYQLPDFEKLAEKFYSKGIDVIYCLSVNDAFVMNAWGKSQNLKNIQLIPDGSGEFSRKLGMLVAKDNLGFGMRSWRYAAIIKDQIITHWFEEPGFSDNYGEDPYSVSAPQHVLENM